MGLSTKKYYVKDLIIDDEYGTISSKATINEAAKKMKELGIPDLVIVEEGTEKVLGIIGDFDIVQDVIAEGLDPNTSNVIKAMYKITPVTLDTPVTEAFTRMRDLQANVVPVVENGKLLGVCSIHDTWSYIPDENVDEIGLIQVNNTRMAEFLFTTVCSILAVLIGIFLPFGGAYGLFAANQIDLSSLFGIVFLFNGRVTFQLFDAKGINYFVSYGDISALNGPIWISIMVFSALIIIFGVISLISLIYVSYTGKKYNITELLLRNVFPILLIVFMVIEWILFGSAFALSGLSTVVAPDALGLSMSIISMVLIIAAINHDRFFRQKGTSRNREVK